MSNNTLSLGEIIIEPSKQSAYYRSKIILLRKKEYQLLEFMARNKDRVLNKLTILEYVWNYDASAETKTLEVHMAGLRKKLKHYKNPARIKTVHGFGYMLCDYQ